MHSDPDLWLNHAATQKSLLYIYCTKNNNKLATSESSEPGNKINYTKKQKLICFIFYSNGIIKL